MPEFRARSVFVVLATAALLAVLIAPGQAHGDESVTFPARPASLPLIVDEAGVLDASSFSAISAEQKTLFSQQQTELAVVTITSLEDHSAQGYSIEAYATALFNNWQISGTGNKGILLLVSIGDRRARIELGAGWARTYDANARAIMDSKILPSFREERYASGIVGGVFGLSSMARATLRPEVTPAAYSAPSRSPIRDPSAGGSSEGASGLVYLAAIALLALFVFGMIKAPGTTSSIVLGCLLGLVFAALTGGKGGASGGFSGGGGATGSW